MAQVEPGRIKSLPPDKKLKMLLSIVYELSVLEDMLNRVVIGQPRYVRALLTAVMSKEHVALISPPGTAKSYLVKTLARAIKGARFYQALLNPYITYDELFGPLDVSKLVEGRAQRRWSDLVRADFAFLDEGFKANPALLNTLLSLLNERIVYDPFTGTEMSVPLKTAVVASNEVPRHPALKALWDRIVVRVYGRYLTDPRKVLEAALSYWRTRPRIDNTIPLDHIVAVEELVENAIRDPGFSAQLGGYLSGGLLQDYMALYYLAAMKPLLALHRGEVAEISNRTLIQKMPKIFLSELLLNLMETQRHAGTPLRSLALYNAYMASAAYLAGDEDEVEEIERTAVNMLGSARTVINTLLEAYTNLLASSDAAELRKSIERLRSLEAAGRPRIDPSMFIDTEENSKALGRATGAGKGHEYLAGMILYYAPGDAAALRKALEAKLASLEARVQAIA